MPITTVAYCKAFRGIEAENTEHDAELDRLISAVQTWLEGECGRAFDSAQVTEYYSGEQWTDRLLIARPPIINIVNLWDDTTWTYSTPLAAAAYAIENADAGLVIRLDGGQFAKGRRNIKITYVGGFATMPADLEQAAIELVWAAREKGHSNLIGVRSRSVGDGNVQFVNLDWGSSNLAPIIDKYRLMTGVAG